LFEVLDPVAGFLSFFATATPNGFELSTFSASGHNYLWMADDECKFYSENPEDPLTALFVVADFVFSGWGEDAGLIVPGELPDHPSGDQKRAIVAPASGASPIPCDGPELQDVARLVEGSCGRASWEDICFDAGSTPDFIQVEVLEPDIHGAFPPPYTAKLK